MKNMQLLDEFVKKEPDARLGKKLVFLISDFIESLTDWKLQELIDKNKDKFQNMDAVSAISEIANVENLAKQVVDAAKADAKTATADGAEAAKNAAENSDKAKEVKGKIEDAQQKAEDTKKAIDDVKSAAQNAKDAWNKLKKE